MKSLQMMLKAVLGVAVALGFVLSSIASAKPSVKKQAPAPAAPVAAAVPTANLQAEVKKEVPAEKKPAPFFSGLFGTSMSQNLVDRGDGTFKQGVDFEARVNTRLGETYSVLVWPTYSLDPKDDLGSDWGDIPVILSHKEYKIGSALTLKPSVSTLVPVSKNARANQGLQGSLGGSLTLGFQEGALKEGLGISVSAGITRYFHQYEEAVDTKVNSQYGSKQSFSIEYSMGRFGVSALLVHRNSISYQGFLGEAFEHGEELSYQLSDKTSVAFGHQLSGGMLGADGRESNFKFLNLNESKVYGSITLLF